MKTPIIDGMKKYVDEDNVRFHMPGHKGRQENFDWSKFIPTMDLTEVEGTDNLHNPKDIILESQRLASKVFKAKETLYSVNGTTGGMYIAISTVVNPGDKVLIQRNCHKCVYNSIILNRLDPVYIYPEYDEENHILLGVSPEKLEKALKEDEDIKVVVLTNPSFYGVTSDIYEMVKIVNKYDRILVVDEAHGSHLVLSDRLPVSAMEAGVDIAVESTHKSLLSFTQTSMIHVGTDKVDLAKLRAMSSVYQTTSPSYILMASLDLTQGYLAEKGNAKMKELLDTIHHFKEELKDTPRVKIFDEKYIHNPRFKFDDTKVLVSVDGIRGTNLMKILREKYNIQMEMADYYYTLAIGTIMDVKEDYEKLAQALKDIAKNEPYEDIVDITVDMIRPKIAIPLWEAFYREKEVIPFKDSIGRVSADFLIPYPPGIPIVSPGEEITKEIYEAIEFLKENYVEIIGPLDYNKGRIKVVK